MTNGAYKSGGAAPFGRKPRGRIASATHHAKRTGAMQATSDSRMLRKAKRRSGERRKRRVKEPLTEELLEELLSSPTVDGFAAMRRSKIPTLSQYLQELLESKDLRRIDVIHHANLNETFGYQVFTGARKAGRDKLLQIAFAMRLSLRETNRLLQAGHVNGLYCKDRRDAIIIYCLAHESTLAEVNEELYRFGEQTVC